MYSLLLLKLLQVVFLYQAITFKFLNRFTGKNAIYGKYIPEDDVIQYLLGYIDQTVY